MANKFHIRTNGIVLDNFNNEQNYAYVLTYDSASKQVGFYTGSSVGGGGSSITIKDEGTSLTTGVTSIDFVGNGVSATNVGSAVTVTISTGSVSSTPWYIATGSVTASVTTGTASFQIVSGSNTFLSIISSSITTASVGINYVPNPSYSLDINGSTRASGTIYLQVLNSVQAKDTPNYSGYAFAGATARNTGLFYFAPTLMCFDVSGQNVLKIADTNLTTNVKILFGSLTNAASITYANTTSTPGLLLNAGATGSTIYMVSGSVVIGPTTFTSSSILNVAGDTFISGTLATSGSVVFRTISNTSASNYLTYDSLTGKVYYAPTSSISTIVFPYSGSAVISGSLTITGSQTITGSLNVSGGITGSLFGTASLATNFASASNYVLNSQTASFATTGSNTFSGSQVITGSLTISGSTATLIVTGTINVSGSITGSLFGTASYASAGPIPWFIATGSITASVNVATASIFQINSGSRTFVSINNQGTQIITGSVFMSGSKTINFANGGTGLTISGTSGSIGLAINQINGQNGTGNKTHLLIGTTTLPGGNYAIYNNLNLTSYFGGTVEIGSGVFLLSNSSTPIRLGSDDGITGQYLTSQGPNVRPVWVTPPAIPVEATIQQIDEGTTGTEYIGPDNLEQSKYTSVNIFNNLNFI